MNEPTSRAIEEINEMRETLNRMEAWLKQNSTKFDGADLRHDISTSLQCGKPSFYVWAGNNPKELAKRFGGSCSIRSDSWDMTFPDFQLVFMEAESEAREVVL